ncbi:hypothetical protein SynWH8103_02131 [Synechococcus sp. WH 8103]|nr:hypothetical protein SynA18461_02172 [Synechococcus sp. A18-46.1]CRY92846.1 hypothetical protein SynWH8103_02131 [Synechococcus sp. WH 8103]
MILEFNQLICKVCRKKDAPIIGQPKGFFCCLVSMASFVPGS